MTAIKIIVFFAALVISLILGDRLKINAGLLALAFAFVIGVTLGGMSVSAIINLFPVRVFYNLMIATLFYGFANENGTMELFTKRLVYLFRRAQWAMPLVLFVIAAVISASGANLEASVLLLSPIGFSLAMEMNFNPFLVAVGIWAGGCAGNWVPWSSFTNGFAGQFSGVVEDAAVTAAFNKMFVTVLILLVVIVLVMFFLYRGYRAHGSAEMKDVAFNPAQKKTLAILFISLIVIVVPSLVQLALPNSVTLWMSCNLSIQSVAAVSSALMALMKLADSGAVIKNRVPWSMLVMISGVTMLMGLVTPLGITDAVSAVLSGSSIPVSVVVAVVCALFALLSFFVSGVVLQPLIVSLCPVLMGLGLSVGTVVTAAQAGGILSSLSPYSAAGAMAISGCPEKYRVEVSRRMIIWAVVYSVAAALLGLAGIYN